MIVNYRVPYESYTYEHTESMLIVAAMHEDIVVHIREEISYVTHWGDPCNSANLPPSAARSDDEAN